MNAKAFLNQLEKLDRLIENKRMEREQWYLLATSTTAGGAPETGVRVQSSGSQQRMADAMDRYIDAGAEIDVVVRRLFDARQEIIAVIEQLNTAEYDVLHKRYVGVVSIDPATREKRIYRMSLQEIADAHEKSYTWATAVHGSALKKVQQIIDEKKIAPIDELWKVWKSGENSEKL